MPQGKMDEFVFNPFVAFCARYDRHNNVDAQARSCLIVVQKYIALKH